MLIMFKLYRKYKTEKNFRLIGEELNKIESDQCPYYWVTIKSIFYNNKHTIKENLNVSKS